MVTRIEHPPLHLNKALRFKLTEEDYFGAYSKLKKNHSLPNIHQPLVFE